MALRLDGHRDSPRSCLGRDPSSEFDELLKRPLLRETVGDRARWSAAEDDELRAEPREAGKRLADVGHLLIGIGRGPGHFQGCGQKQVRGWSGDVRLPDVRRGLLERRVGKPGDLCCRQLDIVESSRPGGVDVGERRAETDLYLAALRGAVRNGQEARDGDGEELTGHGRTGSASWRGTASHASRSLAVGTSRCARTVPDHADAAPPVFRNSRRFMVPRDTATPGVIAGE